MTTRPSVLETYARFLPLHDPANLATLGEGDTPLVRSRWFGPQLGIDALFFKCEHLNPTGSYKDRFAALQVSLMRERRQPVCLATSSGNTGSALAAYCARYGIKCLLFLNESTPEGKLAQMRASGAVLNRVRGFGHSPEETDRILAALRSMAEAKGVPLVVSAYAYCPEGMEGVKTTAYEIAADLGRLPADVFVPVGGGGAFAATARGFADLIDAGRFPAPMPRLHVVQPRLNDTVVTPLRAGAQRARTVDTTTALSGLAVPVDIDATRALHAARQSGGSGYLIDDELAWRIQGQLARFEGCFVEPSGAVALAGLWQAARAEGFRSDGPVVCVLTGHAFKDPVALDRIADRNVVGLIDPDDIGPRLLA